MAEKKLSELSNGLKVADDDILIVDNTKKNKNPLQLLHNEIVDIKKQLNEVKNQIKQLKK